MPSVVRSLSSVNFGIKNIYDNCYFQQYAGGWRAIQVSNPIQTGEQLKEYNAFFVKTKASVIGLTYKLWICRLCTLRKRSDT